MFNDFRRFISRAYNKTVNCNVNFKALNFWKGALNNLKKNQKMEFIFY